MLYVEDSASKQDDPLHRTTSSDSLHSILDIVMHLNLTLYLEDRYPLFSVLAHKPLRNGVQPRC